MIGKFSYKDIDSDNFNLICKSVKRPILSAPKRRTLGVLDASGVHDFGGSEYEPKEVVMKIAYIGNNYFELRDRARDIAVWLDSQRWEKLIINDEPDKYYLARVNGEVNLNTLRKYGECDIGFICQPFAYKEKVVEVFNVIEPKAIKFYNGGTRKINFKSPQGSYSVVIVDGTWTNLIITINNKTMEINKPGNGSKLIIDNINMEITIDNLNGLKYVTGDLDSFYEIIHGENEIMIEGIDMSLNLSLEYNPMYL